MSTVLLSESDSRDIAIAALAPGATNIVLVGNPVFGPCRTEVLIGTHRLSGGYLPRDGQLAVDPMTLMARKIFWVVESIYYDGDFTEVHREMKAKLLSERTCATDSSGGLRERLSEPSYSSIAETASPSHP